MADISKITIGEITYDIKDSVARSQGGSAANVSYDNTDSGLAATNVQDAIDELNTKIYDAGNYETVSLTIGSADSTFSPVGQTITVTLEDGSSTDYVLTNSLVISFSVQKGVRYTISGTNTADYRILPVSYVATLQTRLITMRYIPVATGVFILQSNGDYYIRQEYDAETLAEDAVGVLVLTSALINANHGIVLHKDVVRQNSTVVTTSLPTTVGDLTSLNGYSMTERYVAIQGSNTLPGKCYAIEKTVNSVLLHGYMGTYAEYNVLNNNSVELNNCLGILGMPIWSVSLGYFTMSRMDGNNSGVTISKGKYYNTATGNALPLFYYPLT